ncbi:MAG: glycosyl transferase group 1 [bacterium]|nr:glycosyl transferase group 1 [bacterium]
MIIGGDLAGGQLVAQRLIEGVRAHGHDGLIVSPTRGAFTEAADKANIRVCYADVSRSFKLDGLIALRRLIRDERVDLVHTHAELASNVLSRIAARTTGRPVVSHVHAPTTFRRLPVVADAYKQVDNVSARLCARLIAVSDATRRSLIEQGIPARLVETIHNGLEPPKTLPAPADLGFEGRVLACIGRVEPAKGQAELIEALAELPSDVALVIVGSDVDGHRRRLERLAAEFGVRDRVLFTGQRTDVSAIVAASDVVVLPSWTEGLPIVPLEAMALRKPVVATAVGGTPEVVADGETGLLVPPHEPRRLARALNDLLADPARAAAMGEAGHRRLRDRFSERQMIDRVLAVYRDAV